MLKSKEKKAWEITLEKINRGQPMDGSDWWVLRGLINNRVLLGKKKKLKTELLKILYSIREDEKLDEEMKFTRKCIEREYIILSLWKGDYIELEDVKLKKRR